MPTFLNLFIRQPYDVWNREYNYGEPMAVDAGRAADHVRLSTDLPEHALIYAACSGELSVFAPTSSAVGFETLPDDLEDLTLPETVDLWLMINPLEALASERMTALQELTGIEDPGSAGQIAFVYYNVHLLSLMDAVREQLQWSTVPPADSAIDDGEIRKRMRLFLMGKLSIFVDASNPLGRAANGPDPLSPNPYQIGFGVTTAIGPSSPGEFFNQMRLMVTEAASIDDFLQVVPQPPTPFSAAESNAAAILLTAGRIYPYGDLEQLREDRDLTRAEWRTVGNNQKRLYRQRLLARYGLLPAGVNVPPFEFSASDSGNLFQLEAVVEFFANFTDPWAPAPHAVPIDVSATDLSDIDRSTLVLQGPVATLIGSGVGRRIQLDGDPELSKVQKFHHFIYLSGVSSVHLYRITEVTLGSKQVTAVDSNGNPPAGPAGAVGPWRIDLYTEADFIPFYGGAAQIAGNSVTLDGALPLERLKAIAALPNAEARARCLCDGIIFTSEPSKMYPINSADPVNGIVQLENVSAALNGTASVWSVSHVPILVMIDPIGPRLEGTQARVVVGSPNNVVLENVDLSKVNIGGFETIRLASDTARKTKTYRIVDIGDSVLVLEGNPTLEGGVSDWCISAGLGGRFDLLKYDLGPKEAPFPTGDPDAHPPIAPKALVPAGFDHYDGLLFVIDNGKVVSSHRWTSYTSRTNFGTKPDAKRGGNRRSIRGNHRFEVFSSTSTPSEKDNGSYRNYCFRINDVFTSDSVFGQARNCFDANVPEAGQRHIRFHHGNSKKPSGGTGSAGCNVSPEFASWRDDIIKIHQRRYAQVRGVPEQQDADLIVLEPNHDKSVALQKRSFGPLSPPATERTPPILLEAGWDLKIFCYYWLIRPEERPLS